MNGSARAYLPGMRWATMLCAALAGAVVQGCALGPTQTFDGVYAVGFETQAFFSADGQGPWWVDGRLGADRRLEEAVRQSNAGHPWGSVRVEVRGALSPAGAYGHMGAYEHRLTVYEVLSVEPFAPDAARG